MARLVARRPLGAFEPGHGVVQSALLDQVHADVVVGVAEVGIDLDGALALGDRALDVAGVRIGPAEEGVCLGGGAGHRDIGTRSRYRMSAAAMATPTAE